MSDLVLIAYTTLYREGGAKFARVARTMARDKAREHPDAAVVCEAVERKRAFLDLIARATADGARVRELHFVGHGGMYGPMFGTTRWPEQLSPHEWRNVRIPWADGASAYFHTCRSARWFAPFFARTLGVPAHGYHLYTTFSRSPRAFRHELFARDDAPLYVFGLSGRRSHGPLGSVRKYAGLARVEPIKRFEPEPPEGDASYDAVAGLYDDVFDDIRVRRDEWRYLSARVPAGARVLDVGCGNGALLRALAPRIAEGVGVDVSGALIARARDKARPNLSFTQIRGPVLPFPEGRFDVVVSCLSFRYLDWDPILAEVGRVLVPGGRLLIVDMVAVPAALRETPRLLVDKARELGSRVSRRRYRRALGAMVRDPRWKTMLRYNPIRAQHEYVWYLTSRFPKGELEVLNVGFDARILAFDTGPFEGGRLFPESFP